MHSVVNWIEMCCLFKFLTQCARLYRIYITIKLTILINLKSDPLFMKKYFKWLLIWVIIDSHLQSLSREKWDIKISFCGFLKLQRNCHKVFKGGWTEYKVLWTKFIKIYLRHIRCFYDVHLLSLRAKSTFIIMNLGGYVFRICF